MSLDTPENDLRKRVEELERQLHRTRRIGIAVVAVLVVWTAFIRVQHHYQDTAQAFVLTDSTGRVRGKLAMLSEGPGLEMYAASGERRVALVGGGEDAALNLFIPVTAKKGAASVNLFQDDTLISSFKGNSSMSALEMHSLADGGSALLSLQGGAASLSLAGSANAAPKVFP